MKASKLLTLIFLCSIGHLAKIYAQKDYVVTKNNDTVFCKIKTNSYGEYRLAYKYKVNKNDDFVKIDSNITAYHLANDSAIYLLKTLPKIKYKDYVKLFVRGRINLYAYEDETGMYGPQNAVYSKETFLYANKNEGDLVQIKHASQSVLGVAHSQAEEKQAFIDLISDNPNLAEKFKKVKYDFLYILKYVRMYNTDYLNNNNPAK